MRRWGIALGAAAAVAACGPAERDGGTVTATVTGPGPWQVEEVTDLAFTIDAETADDGGRGVACEHTDLGGVGVYRVEAFDDSVQGGVALSIAVDGYVGPDTYFRSAESELEAFALTVETSLQIYDLSPESGGECDLTIDPGEASGSFDCRSLPEYSVTTAQEEDYFVAGTWSCLGLLRTEG